MPETDIRFKSVSHDGRWGYFYWARRTQRLAWIDAVAPEQDGPPWLRFHRRDKRWLVFYYFGSPATPSTDFYSPLESNPELFRTFGSLRENDEADYAKFADTYGCLGIWSHITTTEPNPRRGLGESLKAWHWNHRLMQALLSVYDAARRSRVNDLAEWLDIQPSKHRGPDVLSVEPRRDSPAALPRNGVWGYGGLDLSVRVVRASSQSERIKRIALRWVANAVNLQLAGATFDVSGVTARLSRISRNDDFGVQIVPASLLGAMWLQFANTIEGQLNYRRCKNVGCGRWMLVDPGGKRAHADFCGDNCRLRHWRKMQKRRR